MDRNASSKSSSIISEPYAVSGRWIMCYIFKEEVHSMSSHSLNEGLDNIKRHA